MVDKDPKRIRRMFAAIAHRYDFLNHLLSLWVDRSWRRRAAREVFAGLSGPALVLDLCTGTGDLAMELAARCRVVGCDFCHPMLVEGLKKLRGNRLERHLGFAEGDALCLPFRSGQFDAVTIAFGLRNLADVDQGLREMLRILRPDGLLAILEFSQPRLPLLRQLYLFYFSRLLPRIGDWISGGWGAYSYLCSSVREFASPEQIEERLAGIGCGIAGRLDLSKGIVTLYLGRKNPASR